MEPIWTNITAFMTAHWKWYLGVSILGIIIHQYWIRYLNRVNAHQEIYDLSPQTHQAKVKTPTFGGVAIIAILIISLIKFPLTQPLIWVMSVTGLFFILGLLDDLLSKVFKHNQGLTSRQKFILQWGLALMSCGVLSLLITPIPLLTQVYFSFIIVATANATNLTDGCDGLLASNTLVTLAGLALYISYTELHNTALVPNSQSVLPVLFGLVIACLTFLVFNKHPAKIFMGDTGSMAIGGAIASMAILTGNPWILLPLGAVYILETLSVIIQVAIFKRTKKRVFLMSPLHHHFELMGFNEWAVFGIFLLIQLSFLGLFIIGYL